MNRERSLGRFMNKVLRLVGLLAVTSLAVSCASMQARAPVAEPLAVPAPPPRVVLAPPPDTIAQTETPQPAQSQPVEPATAESQTRGRAESPTTPTLASPPDAAPAPPRAASPAPGSNLTLRAPAGASNESAAEVRGILDRAARSLDAVSRSRLSPEAQTQYDTARHFIMQAQAAVKVSNLVFARYLAEKAETLAKGLQ